MAMRSWGVGLSGLVLGAAICSVPLVQAQGVQAPLGRYTAEMGGTTRTTRVAGKESGGQRSNNNPATAGMVVNLNITCYTPKTELQAVAKAGQGNLAGAIGKYNCGTVNVAGVNYPVNLATSYKLGANYHINLLSAKPFAGAGAAGNQVQGAGVGMIHLVVPVAGGAGTGKLYRVTPVRVTAAGEVRALGAINTATDLVNVVGGGLGS